jgi:hypothetical protein
MKFIYELTCDCGYAEILFEHGNFKKSYTVEFCLCEELRELLIGMISLKRFNKGNCTIISQICDRQMLFGNTYVWTISVGSLTEKFIFKYIKSGIVNLRIVEDHGSWEKRVFKENINLNELIDNILDSCSRLLKKYGIIGYYANFWLEFPVSHYLLLKYIRNNNFSFTEYGPYEKMLDGDEECMHITDLEKEIDYLRK